MKIIDNNRSIVLFALKGDYVFHVIKGKPRNSIMEKRGILMAWTMEGTRYYSCTNDQARINKYQSLFELAQSIQKQKIDESNPTPEQS
jgi:hypothetical protein